MGNKQSLHQYLSRIPTFLNITIWLRFTVVFIHFKVKEITEAEIQIKFGKRNSCKFTAFPTKCSIVNIITFGTISLEIRMVTAIILNLKTTVIALNLYATTFIK